LIDALAAEDICCHAYAPIALGFPGSIGPS